MSRFLAPIHYWLYGKIMVMEDIETSLLDALATEALKTYHWALTAEYGDLIGDTPLETVIDQGNIHGWLQSKISAVETRQAKLIDFAYKQGDIQAVAAQVMAVYHKEGFELGTYRQDNKLETAPEIFKALGDSLLEGMPCDRVNAITDQSPEAMRWDVVACVHEAYWNQEVLKVQDYYQFRAAFSRGFVEGINPLFTYAFDNTNGQKHAIFKKA